ncbi:helix-turn-helix domain-containing protein [Thalassospira sp. TSL5-1]|uniref:helix-turn-helix domain-containing protein n=1 Tax=Thalassospira sp. TSL5-1 TaxID=1544451 RepID=UPI00093E1D66|nr:XRE family transcriptional regulator [Thalassospira sp. TSL5-1]OKH86450.1 XRE family transcriptional regulator [Thalassospira sp. TSL5-1]
MEQTQQNTLDQQIARQLRHLRQQQTWSLDTLASKTGISKSTLSRLEKADVSPTTDMLAKLCSAYSLTLSRLMLLIEEDFQPYYPVKQQPVWTDPETGFIRRSLSPPASTLAGEVLECTIPANTTITYAQPPKIGLEHHLVLQEGELTLSLDNRHYTLKPGDSLRYQLTGTSCFQTPPASAARYYLFIV